MMSGLCGGEQDCGVCCCVSCVKGEDLGFVSGRRGVEARLE